MDLSEAKKMSLNSKAATDVQVITREREYT